MRATFPASRTRPPGRAGSNVYFRGVASGENANHSASLPSVGTYLDEQPITTITGALDIHVFDIARVEALAGPQGTLYGASSQAGTVRIITNKPDTSRLLWRGQCRAEHGRAWRPGLYRRSLRQHADFGQGGGARRRLVPKDAGYIDNVPGTSTFPTSGIVFNNDALGRGGL